ncbi:unnamed protein product [Rotaria socialis]|uniref:Uncharacterized protein n=2 Tax=Rotaria socialis TaxID=392032 RepID=A0A818CMK8_9BILA|nr:unnamed protein product [Rotaria socialis]CAF4504505.1 unnamed protein product [Rotaria socialis]
MEDDNLIFLLNTNKSEATTPNQQRREPLVEITDNDDHDSIVAMTCLNDRIEALPPSNGKRHFDDIKLVRPSSATSQGPRSKKQEKVIHYAPHLTSGGNRNSNDNLIQSSIDVTLSSNSSPAERRQRPPPTEDELGIITIVGVEDNGQRENENAIDRNFHDQLSTPIALPKPSISSQVHSTPDVQITRFDKDPITSKAAFARSQLAKRLSVNQGQQRSVPIQSLSNTTNNDLTTTSEQTATSLAATVAASVAVSVAQPFLKLQNDFEQRMNTVLNQIQQQRSHTNGSGVVVPVTHVQPANDSVDTRIKQMEKVQEQQEQALKQLADLVQTSKGKSKSPIREHKIPTFESNSTPSPKQNRHFLDTLVGTSSPPVRLMKSPKKHHAHKKPTTSPSASSNKRPSRVTSTDTRTVKIRSPVKFKEQPPNSHFNIEQSSPFACSVCDRSRSRSRSQSRSPTKGLSPDSSYPRPFVPVPRPPSIMSDGFIPSSTSATTGNALKETYPPFDKYLNNSIPPSPLQPKPVLPINENMDLHERVKQIDEAKNLLDENYLTLHRRQNEITLLKPITDESLRVQRLVEQCVKQVTRQVREEVKLKLEQDEIENDENKTVATATSASKKKRPSSKTHLAFDRHSTTRAGKPTSPTRETSTSSKPYSDVFMEAVYGRSLYDKIKKEGKQPYFKLKQQAIQRAKQAKQIEQIPVKDTGLKPSPCVTVPPRRIIEQPPPVVIQPSFPSPRPPQPAPVYEPEYYKPPDGVILLGPPQIRDTRTFQPNYVPCAPKLTPHILPSVDVDPSPKKVRFGNKNESIRVDLDDNEEKEEEDDDDGRGIEIPGYHGKRDDHQPTYDGPRFPPTIPHDEGYRNRQYDTLQSGAVDWLEQELIARFMSQLQNQQTTVPMPQHRDVISARSSTSTSSDDRSIHDRLLDLLGQDGFQLFIDMGQPIDQDLIQALTREVLEERIAQMVGYRSPRESIHVLPPPAPPPRTTTPTTSTTTVLVDHNHHWPQENGVATPQPTPPQSPAPHKHQPRQEISSESEPTTPRSITPVEDLIRPLPTTFHHSIGTPDASESPSPPSTPRIPQPPVIIQPPAAIEKRDASTMASIELPTLPPPVIVQPPRPPSPPRPPKPRTPSPVSSTSSSSSSSTTSSTNTSTFSVPYSNTDSPFSDHMWFDDRSEGQIDLLEHDRPQTELILKQAQRLIGQRRQYSSVTPAGMSFVSPPFSPAGGTHTLSIGEVPPQYPTGSSFPPQENGHTTPSGSDESNNSGKSEGEAGTGTMNGQQRSSVPIKYRKPTQGFLGKKNNRK